MNSYTVEELEGMLERAKLLENNRPNLRGTITSEHESKLRSLAESYMRDSERGVEIDSEYAYEIIMEVFYGDGVWDYINKL